MQRWAIAIAILTLLIAGVAVFPAPVAATTGTLTISTNTHPDRESNFGSIVIAANGITLDCAGFSVIGAGTGIGILLIGRTGVVVKNCQVTGFSPGNGFVFSASNGNTLTGNTASGNGFAGFILSDSNGN